MIFDDLTYMKSMKLSKLTHFNSMVIFKLKKKIISVFIKLTFFNFKTSTHYKFMRV